MNEQQAFERLVADSVSGLGPLAPSDGAVERTIARADCKRQRPTWLALIKEPPMRTDSRLAVGSPTVRIAAIAIATLLLAALVVGASIAGTRLLAADAAIVVAPDGSGDFTTITDAVAAAQDADTILVRPGAYEEAVIIDRDITLAGDGPVEGIIVRAPEDGPTAPTGDEGGSLPAPYALLIEESDATVSGITFVGLPSRVHVAGGSPVLDGLVFQGVGDPAQGSADGGSLLVSGGSSATLRDSVFEGGVGIFVHDGSEPLISGNVLRSGAVIGGRFGDGAVVRGNEIRDASGAMGIRTPTMALFEDNVIADATIGIYVDRAPDVGEGPRIRANAISGCVTGISVNAESAPRIEENTFTGNDAGISLNDGAGTALIEGNEFVDNSIGIGVGESAARIEGNTIQGGTTGIVVSRGATAAITGNTVEGAANRGITVANGASPTISDNRICHNGTNVVVADGAAPTMQGNDICPD